MKTIDDLSVLSHTIKENLKVYRKDKLKTILTYQYESVDSILKKFIVPLIREINILISSNSIYFNRETNKLECANDSVFKDISNYYKNRILDTYNKLYKLIYDPSEFRTKYCVLINNNEELNKFGFPDYREFEMPTLNMFLTLLLRNILVYYLYSDFKYCPFRRFQVNHKKLTKRGLIRIIKDLAQPDSIWWLDTDKAKKIADYLIAKLELIKF